VLLLTAGGDAAYGAALEATGVEVEGNKLLVRSPGAGAGAALRELADDSTRG
jgi:hypothetical protein